MLGFVFPIIWKILEWTLVTALVLTYIEIAPGGESINAIVQSLKAILIHVHWHDLIHSITVNLQHLFTTLFDSFNQSSTMPNQADVLNQCADQISKAECIKSTK